MDLKQALKIIKKEIEKGYGKKRCEETAYGCGICDAWMAYETLVILLDNEE